MPLPLYLQIGERLTREIAAGLLADGARLPPEVAMARDLKVSVGTLRKALAVLAAQGLLVRRQGSGNYVRRSAGPAGIYGFLHLELARGGGMPSARNISVERDAPPAPTQWSGAWRIRRLRRLNAAPAALEEIWIDARHAAALSVERLPEALYRAYALEFGLWIAQVEDRVGPGRCPDWTPPDFPLAAGAACGHVARVALSRDDRVEEVSRTWFDPATTAYVARWREERS